MAYIGIDLHTDKFTVNFKDGDKRDNLESYYLYDNEIRKFIKDLSKDDYVFIEASTPTFAFSDRIKNKVKEVIVVDPFQFKAIANSGKKNDKVDARTLAKMGKYHVETGENFLPEVHIPEEIIRKLRALFTTYKIIKKQITMTKNRIHSLFKQNLKPYYKTYIFEELRYDLDAAGLDEEYQIQIEILLEILDKLEEKKAEIKKEILLLGEPFMEDIDILVSISGISVFTALGLIADYATIDRFQNAKQFSKYLRSTPKSETSNKKTKNGKTQKSGRKLSIELMLQSITHFRRENFYIERTYSRLKTGKSAGKAKVAVVRRMLVAIFFMLKSKEYYKYTKETLHERKMKEYRRFLDKNRKIA